MTELAGVHAPVNEYCLVDQLAQLFALEVKLTLASGRTS